MYGRINPVRDCASCTVATPSSPSVRTASVSARGIFRMMVGFTFFTGAGAPPPARTYADTSPRLCTAAARCATPARLPRWGPRCGRRRWCPSFERLVDPWIHLARVALEDLAPVLIAQLQRIDIPLRVVEVVAGFRIEAADCTDHLRSEQDVVGRHDLQQQLDSRQVVDAGVEEDTVANQVAERRARLVLGEAAVPGPVVRDRTAALRNDEPQRRKILEEIGGAGAACRPR